MSQRNDEKLSETTFLMTYFMNFQKKELTHILEEYHNLYNNPREIPKIHLLRKPEGGEKDKELEKRINEMILTKMTIIKETGLQKVRHELT